MIAFRFILAILAGLSLISLVGVVFDRRNYPTPLVAFSYVAVHLAMMAACVLGLALLGSV